MYLQKMFFIVFVLNAFETMLYQEIWKDMPQTSSTQDTETEKVPLKKRQTIENALFDVEDDEQNNHVRMHDM